MYKLLEKLCDSLDEPKEANFWANEDLPGQGYCRSCLSDQSLIMDGFDR